MYVVKDRVNQSCKGVSHCCLEADDVCVGILGLHVGASWVKFLHEVLQCLFGEGRRGFLCGCHATVTIAIVRAVTVVFRCS